jgi:uncharacterized coiled-coil protein SlyX
MGAIPDYESALELIRELDAQLAAANATIAEREHLLDEWNEKLTALRSTIGRLSAELNRGMDDSRNAARKAAQ